MQNQETVSGLPNGNGAPGTDHRGGSEKLVVPAKAQTSDQKPDKVIPWKNGEAHLRLSKPIETHNGQVAELVFKEPSSGFMLDQENPYRQIMSKTGNGDKDVGIEIRYDNAKMAIYISHMTGIELPFLREMKIRDFKVACDLVFNMIEAEEAGN